MSRGETEMTHDELKKRLREILSRDHSKPYPGVRKNQFADPANRKYPLNTAARVRAAIGYFSRPGNADRYSVRKQREMWKRMVAAARRFDIGLSPWAGPPSVELKPKPKAKRKIKIVHSLDAWFSAIDGRRYTHDGIPGTLRVRIDRYGLKLWHVPTAAARKAIGDDWDTDLSMSYDAMEKISKRLGVEYR